MTKFIGCKHFKRSNGIVLIAPQIAGLHAPPFDLFYQDVLLRQKAFAILEQAEIDLGVIEMARDEASVDHWPLPVTVEDYFSGSKRKPSSKAIMGGISPMILTDHPMPKSSNELWMNYALSALSPPERPGKSEDPLDIPLAPE